MQLINLKTREISIGFALPITPEYRYQIAKRLRDHNGHPGFRGPGRTSMEKLVASGIAEKVGAGWETRYRRGPRWAALNDQYGEEQTREELDNLALQEDLAVVFRAYLQPDNPSRTANVIPFPAQ